MQSQTAESLVFICGNKKIYSMVFGITD